MSSMQPLADFHMEAARHFAQLAAEGNENKSAYVLAALNAALSAAKAEVGSITGRQPLGEQMVKLEVFVSSLGQAPPTKKAELRLLDALRSYISLPPTPSDDQSFADAALELLTVELANWAIKTTDTYVAQHRAG